jgi:hypothetical protein
MAGKDKVENFDLKYLMTLYEDLAESNKVQAKILKNIEVNVGSINTAIRIYDSKFEEQAQNIKEIELKAREVERMHDKCDSKTNIKQLWYHIKRLNAFKDMIKDRASEDSTVIDTHAEKMQHQAELDRRELFGLKTFALKFLPWFLLVFVVGVASATLFITQVYANGTTKIDTKKISIPIVDISGK